MKTKFCNYFPSRGSRSVSTCGLAIWARLTLRISSILLRLFGGGKHYIFYEDNSRWWTFLTKYILLRHTDKDQLTWVGEGRPELEFQVYDSGFWPLPKVFSEILSSTCSVELSVESEHFFSEMGIRRFWIYLLHSYLIASLINLNNESTNSNYANIFSPWKAPLPLECIQVVFQKMVLAWSHSAEVSE